METEAAQYQVSPGLKPSSKYMARYSSIPIATYFWGEKSHEQYAKSLPTHSGNVEAGSLIGDGTYEDVERLVSEALRMIAHIYDTAELSAPQEATELAAIRLSEDLQTWKRQQHQAGRALPRKGFGLKRTPQSMLKSLGAEHWPLPLQTNNSVFGVVWANLAIGACDFETLCSNYCGDMAFYYEHGYHKVFPEFQDTINDLGHGHRHALSTFAGPYRRKAAAQGIRYIRGKVDLETMHYRNLPGKSARVDRRTMQVVSFSESSLIGMAAEAMKRGFDPAAVMADMVFSSPATDVVDVGSDLGNSEIMNSFLNTSDVTNSGVVTEDILRTVYDAYSYTCARIFTERWTTPTAKMNAQLYPWHMLNDRHFFFRRIVLGYAKVRRTKPDQREADLNETFDENLHTTGFSRSLQNACDGHDTCNQVKEVTEVHPACDTLGRLWSSLVIDPLEYARGGLVDEQRERELCVGLQESLIQCWEEGITHEMSWLLAHASQHAWQVNFLMEAAMFGSLLDDGSLSGSLDRAN